MKFKYKRKRQILKQYIIGWTISFLFLCVVRGEGTQELGSVQFEFWQSIFASIIGGSLLGSISGYAQIVAEKKMHKLISLQKLLVLRVLYAILFLLLIIYISYIIFGKNITFIEFAFEPGSFAFYLYIICVDIFMFALRQINLFLGGNNLWKLFSGRFYSPREEERIFMFLDLQSSTTHAERLGHIKYSKMIQDCFNDLGIVSDYESEIYQYVGDEVVLSWQLEIGLRNQNCLMAYFKFQEQLDKKEDYYKAEYNCKPFFKAGLNSGIVTVTEIGKYKKEIAYHGDTINTAARIQGKCNELNQQLLISENLKDAIDDTGFIFEKIGNIELKGKKKTVPIYGIHKNKISK